MKKIMLLLVMVMIFSSGSVFANYHPNKTNWYCKCCYVNSNQSRIYKKITKRIKHNIKRQKTHIKRNYANRRITFLFRDCETGYIGLRFY